jgi:TonB family protein
MKSGDKNSKLKYILSTRHYGIVSFCLFSSIAFSQVEAIAEKKDTTVQKQIMKKNSEFACILMVEPQPEFIGGQKAMFQFLSDNIEMPKFDSVKTKDLSKRNHTVYIGFTVSKNGEIKNVITKKSIQDFPEFEEEAMRVVKLMDGKWTAGKQNGEFVDVNYTLPLKFKIE